MRVTSAVSDMKINRMHSRARINWKMRAMVRVREVNGVQSDGTRCSRAGYKMRVHNMIAKKREEKTT